MKNVERIKKVIDTYQAQKIIEDKILFDKTKFLKIRKRKYVLNNGDLVNKEYIQKGKFDGSAAIILPITEDNKILLVVQPRVPGVCVELPAGYIENYEEPKTAAQRELLEETGYQAKELIELDSYYQDQGCSKAFNHLFLALGCKKVCGQNLDKDEKIDYFECGYDEIEELLKNHYIIDVNSKYALLKAKNLRR